MVVPVEAWGKPNDDYAKLVALVKKLTTKPKEMQDLMRKHDLKIDNLDDAMQKLAFTFYTELCELSREAEHVLEVRKEMGG